MCLDVELFEEGCDDSIVILSVQEKCLCVNYSPLNSNILRQKASHNWPAGYDPSIMSKTIWYYDFFSVI